MSPILVRPIREQFEHDRVIRLLQAKFKRKFEVAVNIAEDQSSSVKSGEADVFPDVVLRSTEKGKRIQAIIEVETSESVNNLEAMAQWGPMGRARIPFHLYVPSNSVDTVKRLVAANDVSVDELWSFHTVADQVSFALVQRNAAHATPSVSHAKPRSVDTRPAARTVKVVKRAKKAAAPARRGNARATAVPKRRPVRAAVSRSHKKARTKPAPKSKTAKRR